MPEPQPLYDAIGRVIFESAHLEVAYGELVGALGGPLGTFFVRGQGPATLKRAAKSLLDNEHVPEPCRTDCRDTLRRADDLLAARNHVAHGRWFAFPEGDQLRTSKPVRHSLRDEVRSWSISDLHKLAHAMVEVRLELFMCQWNVTAGESGMESHEMTAPRSVVSDHQD